MGERSAHRPHPSTVSGGLLQSGPLMLPSSAVATLLSTGQHNMGTQRCQVRVYLEQESFDSQ